MSAALLIIDMQVGLCTGEEAAFDVDNLIARINDLAVKARKAKAPVIFMLHEESAGALVYETEGWRLSPGLTSAPEDIHLRKKTPNSFHQTDLHALLQQHGVTRLVICGQQTELCLDTTVRQAFPLGYQVTLVKDGHSTCDNGVLTAQQIIAHHNQLLQFMGGFGVGVEVVAASAVAFQ
ncbi:cysteine hydrolase family protein [Hahella sp. HN01]|uniref:cysteine hydrolase family protein n=1 Tax=Hahella sp. HN01 TaxID=2847262 RepID=UPI001C1F10A0|nr:cysteine hydrolase family protein [Hahella sp. HN01]MBU6953373.1 cysteine hydrolase [Hahella sp. HN01]